MSSKALMLLRNAWVVFAASVLLHVVVVFAVRHYENPTLWENGSIAQSMLEGRGYRISMGEPPDHPTSWQAPGYPFLLLAAWKTLGQTAAGYLLISLLQAVAVSSMVFPVGWLTERWFGRNTAVLARWIVCFVPLYGWYPTRLTQSAIVMAFQPWLLAGWLQVRERCRAPRAVAVGAGTGLAGLFQPVLLAVFGILAGLFAMHSLLRRERRRFVAMVVAGICTLVVLMPWTIRNYRVHGRLVPIKDSFGKEFWMGNHPGATGSAFAEGGEKDVWMANPPKCLGAFRNMTEIQRMDALLEEGMAHVRENPRLFLERSARRVLWLWTAVPKRLLRVTFGGEALRFWWLHFGYWTAFVLLIIAARVGMGRFRREYALALTVYVVLYSIVYGITIVGNARFRGEMEYIFIPAVAAGVLYVGGVVGRMARRLVRHGG